MRTYVTVTGLALGLLAVWAALVPFMGAIWVSSASWPRPMQLRVMTPF